MAVRSAGAWRWIAMALLWLVLAASAGWGVLALRYFDHLSDTLCAALAAGFGIVAVVLLGATITRRWRRPAATVYLVLFALVLWRWLAIAPSNDRDWQPEGARLASATIEGDRVTVHNIRNFDYRTETDFTSRYYDKSFDLRQLESVDLLAVYWMGPAIAHVFLSFGFAGGDQLAISIEARKELGEGYSSVKGFFRQYELQYIVADERDVIRVRTNYRRDPPEEVHLYRLAGSQEALRRLFLDYLREINALAAQPAFYNTLTANCTGNIWLHSRVNPGHVPFSWKILASGYVPEYLYEQGRLDTSMPFDELQRRSVINALAMAADKDANFSRRIRAGIGGAPQ
jgi:hypothetical protein